MSALSARRSSPPGVNARRLHIRAADTSDAHGAAIRDELSPRWIGRRLIQFAAAGLLIGGFILTGRGIGSLRDRIAHAAGRWLAVGVALEVLSAFLYVVMFRAVF